MLARAAIGPSEAKISSLPSALQLGSACCPEGFPPVVTWRRCDPSASTVKIVDCPPLPQSNHARSFGDTDRNANWRPSGDQTGRDPKGASWCGDPDPDTGTVQMPWRATEWYAMVLPSGDQLGSMF